MTESIYSSQSIRVSIIESIALKKEESNTLIFEAQGNLFRPVLTFRDLSPLQYNALERVYDGMASIPELIGKAMSEEGFTGMGRLKYSLQFLEKNAMLDIYMTKNDEAFVSIHPFVAEFQYRENTINRDKKYVMSKFAYLRNENGKRILNSPLAYSKIIMHDVEGVDILFQMAEPCTIEQLLEKKGSLTENELLLFLNFLNLSGVLQECDGEGVPFEETDPALGQWQFHDLLFHANSRLGRHDDPYGGTFSSEGRFEPVAAIKPDTSEVKVALYKPDMDKLDGQDVPFSRVLETRRTIRMYGNEPITVEQLGEFLFRTYRITKSVEEAGVSWRPSPGGGAIHELEIYPLINKCKDLPNGMYHYNPLEHYLTMVNCESDKLQTLIDIGRVTGKLESEPQILFIIAARFQKIQYKYQSVAYSVILKDVGCLYQTMYLVASAMNLAPCALGGGHSDMFSTAAGLNYYEEASVGDFLLGSCTGERPNSMKKTYPSAIRPQKVH